MDEEAIPSDFESEVLESEVVTRFITQKAYYRSSDNSVRHNAFMPYRGKETSVYRIINLKNRKILEIGNNFVVPILKSPLKGRADILVSKILRLNLKVKPDPNPHPRHANIVDWPDDPSKHKLIALELASEASLLLLNQHNEFVDRSDKV